MNILGFKQIFFEPDALLRERYVKLLLIVVVVRILLVIIQLYWLFSQDNLLVVTCDGGKLVFDLLFFCPSKLQVTEDVSPGPNLPKEKEPPHRGDIGWDRFLLRQFDLQTSSFCPPYKLCNNILAPLPGNTESILLK
jgi:hypothetical protein